MGWFTQDKNDDTHVQVKSGEDHQSGNTPVSDFIIADRDGSGHQHVAIDHDGNEIHNERVDGR